MAYQVGSEWGSPNHGSTLASNLERSQHPVAVDVEFSAVRLDQLSEGGLIAGLGQGDQIGRRHCAVSPSLRSGPIA
jgi:hypothetical protein